MDPGLIGGRERSQSDTGRSGHRDIGGRNGLVAPKDGHGEERTESEWSGERSSGDSPVNHGDSRKGAETGSISSIPYVIRRRERNASFRVVAEERNLYGALTVAALSATLVLALPSTALALSTRSTSLIRVRWSN